MIVKGDQNDDNSNDSKGGYDKVDDSDEKNGKKVIMTDIKSMITMMIMIRKMGKKL